MRIMAVGDVVGHSGVAYIVANLPRIKKQHSIDICIANGENAATGNGITRKHAQELWYAGVNLITLGNHVYDKREVIDIFADKLPIIRPANYPEGAPGIGSRILTAKNHKIGVLNIVGRVYLHPMDCPFRAADREIDNLREQGAEIIIADFHAEATSEKVAMGWHLDGRVSGIFGTHTHVQTADERVLPRGTGYITDIGMSGPRDSVLGVKREIALERFITCIPKRFENSEEEAIFNSVVFDIDETNFKCKNIERVNYM